MPGKSARLTIQRIVKFLVVLLLGIGIWYGQARLFRESRAVQIINIGGDTRPSVPTGTDILVVACFNVAHARGPAIGANNWNSKERQTPEAHLDAIAAQIADSKASIVVLNEIDFNAKWSDGIDQAQHIAERAGFPFLVKQRNFDVTLPFFTLQFGNAILSKYPVKEAKFLKFPALSKREDLFAGNHDGVVATIEHPDGIIRVVAVHLEYRDEPTRVGAAKIVAELVLQDVETPVIAMGDFNSTPSAFPAHETDSDGNNAVEYLIDRAGMKTIPPESSSALADFTYPSLKPDRVIDWILVSPRLELLKRRTVASELSDHRMVVGKISIRDEHWRKEPVR